MAKSSIKAATREWIGKAEDDYRLALQVAGGSEPFHDQVCFHCQQSAEKCLKALLEESGLYVEKTHELEKLCDSLPKPYSLPRALRRGLIFLTNFAVAVRYPGARATKRQAQAAVRWAGRVRHACRTKLGIRP